MSEQQLSTNELTRFEKFHKTRVGRLADYVLSRTPGIKVLIEEERIHREVMRHPELYGKAAVKTAEEPATTEAIEPNEAVELHEPLTPNPDTTIPVDTVEY